MRVNVVSYFSCIFVVIGLDCLTSSVFVVSFFTSESLYFDTLFLFHLP